MTVPMFLMTRHGGSKAWDGMDTIRRLVAWPNIHEDRPRDQTRWPGQNFPTWVAENLLLIVNLLNNL
jgi:hypothetical protein